MPGGQRQLPSCPNLRLVNGTMAFGTERGDANNEVLDLMSGIMPSN